MAESSQWTFLTNHAHVLIYLARKPDQPLRRVALAVGITERAVQSIVADLDAAGYLKRERVGRQNHYRINREMGLRHGLEAHRSIGDLLDAMVKRGSDTDSDSQGLQFWRIGEHGSEI